MSDENAPPTSRMSSLSQRMRQLAAVQSLKSSALSAGNSSLNVPSSRVVLGDVSQKHNNANLLVATDRIQAMQGQKVKAVQAVKPTITINLKNDAMSRPSTASVGIHSSTSSLSLLHPPSNINHPPRERDVQPSVAPALKAAPVCVVPASLSKELEASLSDMSLSPGSGSNSTAGSSNTLSGLNPSSYSQVFPSIDRSHYLVGEYIDDIMEHLKSREDRYQPHSNYMSKQNDINWRMREILVDWLHEVHIRFKLQDETMFLTVNLVDRFLQMRFVDRSKLQLIGCVAMLLAAKYEEIYVPEVDDFVNISDHAYRREEIISMESYVLATLGFHLTVPSSLRFSQRFLRQAHLASLHTVDGYRHDDAAHLINFLLQSTLQFHVFLKYAPSCVAAAAVYLAVHTYRVGTWSPEVEKALGYSVPNANTPADPHHSSNIFKQCIWDLWTTAEGMEKSKYNSVSRKFAKSHFNAISRVRIPKPFE